MARQSGTGKDGSCSQESGLYLCFSNCLGPEATGVIAVVLPRVAIAVKRDTMTVGALIQDKENI